MSHTPTEKPLFTAISLYHAATVDNDMDADTIRQWLARGESPDSNDDEGWTALHLFSQHGNTEAVRTLLEGGADPKLIGRSGLSALHVAKNGEIARLLIAAGAKVNSEGFIGETPLHEVLDELSSFYVGVKTPLNPLGDRCERSRADVVGTIQALIAGGADVNAIGKHTGGQTPLDYADQIDDADLRDQVRGELIAAGGISGHDLRQDGQSHASRLQSRRQAGTSGRGTA